MSIKFIKSVIQHLIYISIPSVLGRGNRKRKERVAGAVIEFCACEFNAPGPNLTKSFMGDIVKSECS